MLKARGLSGNRKICRLPHLITYMVVTTIVATSGIFAFRGQMALAQSEPKQIQGRSLQLKEVTFRATEETLVVRGQRRTYRLFIPDRSQSKSFAGLILDLHGGGGTGLHEEETHNMDEVGQRYNFVVAYPDGLNRRWNDGRPNCPDDINDIEFINQLIETVSLKYKIPSRHAFACGISNGAIFSEHLALKLSNKIGAIASIAGAMSENDKTLKPALPVSVLIVSGTEDHFVPFSGGEINGAMAIGGKVCGHEDTFEHWQDLDGGASNNPIITKRSDSGTSVRYHSHVKQPTPVTTRSVKTKSGAICVSVKVEGGGHTWPGHVDEKLFGIDGITAMNFDASEKIGEFFSRISKQLKD